jgi:hypothetical protein
MPQDAFDDIGIVENAIMRIVHGSQALYRRALGFNRLRPPVLAGTAPSRVGGGAPSLLNASSRA